MTYVYRKRNTPDKYGTIFGKPALIVIDYQKDFTEKDGAIPCHDAMPALMNTLPLIVKAREAKIPVIFTQEYHRDPNVFGLYDMGREADGEDPVHCVIGTHGFELADELLPLAKTDYIMPKPRYSSFIGTDLELILRSQGVDTLIITGVCTNICVHYTFIDAHQKDFWVRVAEDCVAGTSPDAHDHAIKQIRYLQEESIQNSKDLIKALDEYIASSK